MVAAALACEHRDYSRGDAGVGSPALPPTVHRRLDAIAGNRIRLSRRREIRDTGNSALT
jgi:hypothetical protein